MLKTILHYNSHLLLHRISAKSNHHDARELQGLHPQRETQLRIKRNGNRRLDRHGPTAQRASQRVPRRDEVIKNESSSDALECHWNRTKTIELRNNLLPLVKSKWNVFRMKVSRVPVTASLFNAVNFFHSTNDCEACIKLKVFSVYLLKAFN